MRVSLISAALILSVSGWALAQDKLPTSDEVELVVSGPPVEAKETGQDYIYLKPDVPEQFKTSSASILAQGWSMLGREDRGAGAGSNEYQSRPCKALDVEATGQEDILDVIAARALKARVVIINESHEVTLHRDFSRRVLERLRPLGFTVFAAETFSNRNDRPDPIEESADLPFPRSSDGHYIHEPAFGELVRSAKRLGYRLAAYEEAYDPNRKNPGHGGNWRDSIRNRETEQAQNLATLLKSMAPDEKLIVHAGYGHASEEMRVGSDGWDHAWMAARLKRDHGVDPLTVAQTVCRGTQDTVQLLRPSSDLAKQFDLIIDHPVHGFRYGRSDWRFADGALAVDIPKPYAGANEPLIIEAFAQGEPFEAVPVDRVWVDPGEDVKLVLRPGRYTVRAVRPVILPNADRPATPE